MKIYINTTKNLAEMDGHALFTLEEVVYDISEDSVKKIWLFSIFFLDFSPKITNFSAEMHGFVKKMEAKKIHIFLMLKKVIIGIL